MLQCTREFLSRQGGLKFDIPVLEKANTRKYTRREDRENFIDMTQANLDVLSEIMGE